MDLLKTSVSTILLIVCIVNFSLLIYKSNALSIPTNDQRAINEYSILTYDGVSGVKPTSATCTPGGEVTCKKFKVGDIDIELESATNGILYVDDTKLLASKKVACNDEGGITCKRLNVNGVTIGLNANDATDGILIYDSKAKKIEVSPGRPVTTTNSEIKTNHVAVFAAKRDGIVPSAVQFETPGQLEAGKTYTLAIQNNIVKPIGNVLHFDTNNNAVPQLGCVIVHGTEPGAVTHLKELQFDISKIKKAAAGDVLGYDTNRLVSPLKGVLKFTGPEWKKGHLLLSTDQPHECILSPFSLDLGVMGNEEHIMACSNGVLRPIRDDFARVEIPSGLAAGLNQRVPIFKDAKTIVPSTFTFDFDQNGAIKGNSVLVVTDGDKLTLSPIQNHNVALPAAKTAGAARALALYDPATSLVTGSDILYDINEVKNDDVRYALTVLNGKLNLTALPSTINTLVVPAGTDASRNYIPMVGINGVTLSEMYVKQNTLVLPSGSVSLNGKLKIKIDPSQQQLKDGMYLSYDEQSKAFVPKEAELWKIPFETPIADVKTLSYLVYKDRKWDFRTYSRNIDVVERKTGNEELILTTTAKPIPNLTFTPGEDDMAAVIFAQCIAGFKGNNTNPPSIEFYLQHGAKKCKRYLTNVQSAKFRLTNYVYIFETINCDQDASEITVMARLTHDHPDPVTDQTIVNCTDLNDYIDANDVIDANDDVHQALQCIMEIRVLTEKY